MKVLDLPDEQDNPIRQILLKQDDNILEQLAIKSKKEIQAFIISVNETQENSIKHVEIQKNEKKEELKNSLLNENKNQTIEVETKQAKKQNTETEIQSVKEKSIEQKLSKIKSVFSLSILDKNPKIAEQFKFVELLDKSIIDA